MPITKIANEGIKLIENVTEHSSKVFVKSSIGRLELQADVFVGKTSKTNTSLKDTVLNRLIPFRKRILSAKEIAIKNVGNKLSYSGSTPLEDTLHYMFKKLTQDKTVIRDLLQDNSFMEIAQKYLNGSNEMIRNLLVNIGVQQNSESLLKTLVESSGVGPNKILQMMSSNESFMNKLSEEGRSLISSLRSKCTPTRTLSEAQKNIDELFNGKYKIKSGIGTGTVGEAYLVSAKSGQEYVIKMIKKGVTEEKLSTEEDFMSRLISKLAPNQKEADKQIVMLHDLYAQWREEINFVNEARYNELLQKGAKRYNVAGIEDIAHINPEKTISRVIVYKKAEGVQLDALIQMLKDYKANPQQYAEKYKEVIQANKWLAKPEEWEKDLANTYAKALSEMISTPKNGMGVIHGDPHPGNVFITYDQKAGKLKPTFIDTGSIILRDLGELTGNLGLMANFAVGNSKGIARYYINQASFLPIGETKESLVDLVAKKLDETIFKANVNIKNLGTNQKIIDNVLNECGIIIPPDSTSLMKVGMQTGSVSKELANLTGTTFNIESFMPDAIKGLGKVATIKNAGNAVRAIKEPLAHIVSDFDNAIQCCFQYFVH